MKDTLPVILNVYKIKKNSILDSMGINIYHTAIEYDNVEYAFGKIMDSNTSGVYDISPMSYDDGMYLESINLGKVGRREFFVKLEKLKMLYMGDSYNILTKNCNHFTNDLIQFLFNKRIPSKYTSFLKLGEFLRKIF
jgi:hypothetical protein